MKIFIIGDVSMNINRTISDGKVKKDIDLYRECENCPMAWECRGYEGEVEDYGCYFDRDFNVSIILCLLPYWIKKIIKRVKRWE